MRMNIDDAAEMIVLIKERSGRQHAWKVYNGRASFRITGVGGRGRSQAIVHATGEFHRMSRRPDDPIGAAWPGPTDQNTIPPAPLELEP